MLLSCNIERNVITTSIDIDALLRLPAVGVKISHAKYKPGLGDVLSAAKASAASSGIHREAPVDSARFTQ